MKKLNYFLMIFALTVSCKQPIKSQNDTTGEMETTEVSSDYAYAEISVKEGGSWQGQKYIAGKFTPTDFLVLPEQHTDHSDFIRYEGPGWENKNVAYRLYLDWRNAIDIFGKKVDSIVLPYVGRDGYDSYHNEAPWGQDILKAGNSLGIGGFGAYVNDEVVHFNSVKKTELHIENTEEKASVLISYENWAVGKDTINLKSELSILPEDRLTQVTLTPSSNAVSLCTGIVKFDWLPSITSNDSTATWNYVATYGKQTIAGKEDLLGMAIFYKTAEKQDVFDAKDDHLVVFKPSTATLTYYFLAAWDKELGGIKDESSFKNYLQETLNTLNTN